MSMAITKTEMKEVIKELDSVELQLFRLKTMLLPKAKMSRKKLEELRKAEAEIERGSWISGDELIKKLS